MSWESREEEKVTEGGAGVVNSEEEEEEEPVAAPKGQVGSAPLALATTPVEDHWEGRRDTVIESPPLLLLSPPLPPLHSGLLALSVAPLTPVGAAEKDTGVVFPAATPRRAALASKPRAVCTSAMADPVAEAEVGEPPGERAEEEEEEEEEAFSAFTTLDIPLMACSPIEVGNGEEGVELSRGMAKNRPAVRAERALEVELGEVMAVKPVMVAMLVMTFPRVSSLMAGVVVEIPLPPPPAAAREAWMAPSVLDRAPMRAWDTSDALVEREPEASFPTAEDSSSMAVETRESVALVELVVRPPPVITEERAEARSRALEPVVLPVSRGFTGTLDRVSPTPPSSSTTTTPRVTRPLYVGDGSTSRLLELREGGRWGVGRYGVTLSAYPGGSANRGGMEGGLDCRLRDRTEGRLDCKLSDPARDRVTPPTLLATLLVTLLLVLLLETKAG